MSYVVVCRIRTPCLNRLTDLDFKCNLANTRVGSYVAVNEGHLPIKAKGDFEVELQAKTCQ